MGDSGVRVEFYNNGCGVVFLGKGENKLNGKLVTEINYALDAVERNKNCKVLVTVGEGRFYINGVDLEWILSDERNARSYAEKFKELCWRIIHFPLPTVAAINGHAITAGAALALSHDYRVMKTGRGWIWWLEILRNIRFPQNSSAFLTKLNTKVKRDAILYAKRYTAEEAKQDGLVDQVCSSKDLLNVAMETGLKAIGPNDIDRQMLQTMKQDMFPRADTKGTDDAYKRFKAAKSML